MQTFNNAQEAFSERPEVLDRACPAECILIGASVC